MRLNPNVAIERFWSFDPIRRRHTAVQEVISLKRWQQIDRYFHISEERVDHQEETVFDKLSLFDV